MMLSACEPVTAKDLLIMIAAAAPRIDAIASLDVDENQKDTFARDCALIDDSGEAAHRFRN